MMDINIEPRREVADLKRKEAIDLRYKGPARIGPYRRWLQRRLVEAKDQGDQRAVDLVMREMAKAGLTDG